MCCIQKYLPSVCNTLGEEPIRENRFTQLSHIINIREISAGSVDDQLVVLRAKEIRTEKNCQRASTSLRQWGFSG